MDMPNPTRGQVRRETLPAGFARYERDVGGNGFGWYAGIGHTERMPDYLPSMYHDFRLQRPLELDAIYAAPLAAAAAAGCELPKTRMLYQALRFLDVH